MQNDDLRQRLVELNPNVTDDVALQAVRTFFNTIASHLSRGGQAQMRGFGVFFVVRYGARDVRVPKTGDLLRKESVTVLRFRPSKTLGRSLNRK